ncbi:hypothetical protein X759_12370 [Mesorhizobium sp. LSHC420B00]|nr:hypothetical protein X759_12370 [Mesorhizobium sp. LSHC420B00]
MLEIGKTVEDSALLPVTIRGEDAGRQMRGGANTPNRSEFLSERQSIHE